MMVFCRLWATRFCAVVPVLRLPSYGSSLGFFAPDLWQGWLRWPLTPPPRSPVRDFSIVDRTSVAMMERLGITRAASFDEHFSI
jgi:hypothetical protein